MLSWDSSQQGTQWRSEHCLSAEAGLSLGQGELQDECLRTTSISAHRESMTFSSPFPTSFHQNLPALCAILSGVLTCLVTPKFVLRLYDESLVPVLNRACCVNSGILSLQHCDF